MATKLSDARLSDAIFPNLGADSDENGYPGFPIPRKSAIVRFNRGSSGECRLRMPRASAWASSQPEKAGRRSPPAPDFSFVADPVSRRFAVALPISREIDRRAAMHGEGCDGVGFDTLAPGTVPKPRSCNSPTAKALEWVWEAVRGKSPNYDIFVALAPERRRVARSRVPSWCSR
jgi:hypothetical protein